MIGVFEKKRVKSINYFCKNLHGGYASDWLIVIAWGKDNMANQKQPRKKMRV